MKVTLEVTVRPYRLSPICHPSPSFALGQVPKDSKTGLNLVGAAGFEPATPCAQGRCATRLRYAPTLKILILLPFSRMSRARAVS